MMPDAEQPEPLPSFISHSQNSGTASYFYHSVDPDAASLTVDVLGTNLSQTFNHSRARGRFSPSDIMSKLGPKTTGFVAIVAKNETRIPLVWAESGHGTGRNGDHLHATPCVLPNTLWVLRVLQIARLLGIKMGSPYDSGREKKIKLEGAVQGSHVEVKLAVFGVFLLLKEFNIVKRFSQITMSDLNKLSRARWDDGARPVLEIYFSRKNCKRCGRFIKSLQDATGVHIGIRWQHRLELKVYPKLPTRDHAGRRVSPSCEQADIAEVDELDDAGVPEVIELTDETPSPESSSAENPISVAGSPSPTPEDRGSHADHFVDGLAYCFGQMNAAPSCVRDAVLDLARRLKERRQRPGKPIPFVCLSPTADDSPTTTTAAATSADRPVDGIQAEERASGVEKPLPATPETKAPVRAAGAEKFSGQRVKRLLFSETQGEPWASGVRRSITVEIPSAKRRRYH